MAIYGAGVIAAAAAVRAAQLESELQQSSDEYASHYKDAYKELTKLGDRIVKQASNCTQCGAKMSVVKNGVKICSFCKSDI